MARRRRMPRRDSRGRFRSARTVADGPMGGFRRKKRRKSRKRRRTAGQRAAARLLPKSAAAGFFG